MPRLREKEVNEARGVPLFNKDNELNGDTTFEITRWPNEKKVRKVPGKYGQRKEEGRT
jgi:hypothetical protein